MAGGGRGCLRSLTAACRDGRMPPDVCRPPIVWLHGGSMRSNRLGSARRFLLAASLMVACAAPASPARTQAPAPAPSVAAGGAVPAPAAPPPPAESFQLAYAS